LIERAGLVTLDKFVRELGGGVNEVQNAPGREMFSVVEMSRLAPFVNAARSIDANNFRNTFISYYTYGAALALGLDLAIRERFPGKSLDDWMRAVWHRHADINQPYTLEDLQACLAEATGSLEFAELIFKRHINGREPLDFESLLLPAGLKLQKAHPGKPWIGSDRVEPSSQGVKLVDAALRGSPLYAAGLDQGDEITHCDGKVLKKAEDFQSCVEKHAPHENLALEYISRAGAKSASVGVTEDRVLEIVSFEKAGIDVTAAAKSFRASWLGSRSPHGPIGEPVTIW
jgi:predicted metalloprotease with PDZ domain